MTRIHCTSCNAVTPHRHLHDTAWGIPNTHMAGSERYECIECGHAIFAKEGAPLGLVFVCDRAPDAPARAA